MFTISVLWVCYVSCWPIYHYNDSSARLVLQSFQLHDWTDGPVKDVHVLVPQRIKHLSYAQFTSSKIDFQILSFTILQKCCHCSSVWGVQYLIEDAWSIFCILAHIVCPLRRNPAGSLNRSQVNTQKVVWLRVLYCFHTTVQ